MNEEKMVLDNLNLVYFIIKKMNLYNQLEEWIDVGTIGLIKGVKTYKQDKGFKLSTYLTRCIRNEILQEIRNLNTDKRKANLNTISLDKEIYNNEKDDAICLIDTLPSKENVEYEVIKNDAMKDILKGLNDKEKYVLVNSYGLFGKKEIRQNDLAKQLNLSQAQVSRILNNAIQKIKNEKGIMYD